MSVCSFSAKFPSDISGQPSLALLLPRCNVVLSIVSKFWILSFSLLTTRQRQQQLYQLFSQNEPDWFNEASVFVLGKIRFCFVLFFLIEVFIEVVESPNISGLNWRPNRECGGCQILLPGRPVSRKKVLWKNNQAKKKGGWRRFQLKREVHHVYQHFTCITAKSRWHRK